MHGRLEPLSLRVPIAVIHRVPEQISLDPSFDWLLGWWSSLKSYSDLSTSVNSSRLVLPSLKCKDRCDQPVQKAYWKTSSKPRPKVWLSSLHLKKRKGKEVSDFNQWRTANVSLEDGSENEQIEVKPRRVVAFSRIYCKRKSEKPWIKVEKTSLVELISKLPKCRSKVHWRKDHASVSRRPIRLLIHIPSKSVPDT